MSARRSRSRRRTSRRKGRSRSRSRRKRSRRKRSRSRRKRSRSRRRATKTGVGLGVGLGLGIPALLGAGYAGYKYFARNLAKKNLDAIYQKQLRDHLRNQYLREVRSEMSTANNRFERDIIAAAMVWDQEYGYETESSALDRVMRAKEHAMQRGLNESQVLQEMKKSLDNTKYTFEEFDLKPMMLPEYSRVLFPYHMNAQRHRGAYMLKEGGPTMEEWRKLRPKSPAPRNQVFKEIEEYRKYEPRPFRSRKEQLKLYEEAL